MRRILCFILFFLIALPAQAEMSEAEVSKVILQLLKYNHKHKLRKKPEELKRFSLAVLDAAQRADVKAAAIIATAYAESTFSKSRRGKIGELGVMQLHGKAQWSYCRKVEDRKINRYIIEDQLICGAHWLRLSINTCNKTYYQGFARYMTKKTCKPKRRTRLQRVVLRRLRIMWNIQNDKIK